MQEFNKRVLNERIFSQKLRDNLRNKLLIKKATIIY